MRILIVNHYALPPTIPGGTRHYSLAHKLIKNGHQVRIIASNINYLTRQNYVLHQERNFHLETIQEVPFLWYRTPAYTNQSLQRLMSMLTFAVRLYKREGLKDFAPDIVIGSSPHLFAAWAAERLASLYKAPFFLEVRDLWPQTLLDLGKVSPLHPIVLMMDRMEKSLYRKANKIVTLLPGAIDHIEARGGSRDKIVWLPNGIDLSLIPTPVNCPENGAFILTYAGAHGFANDLETLVKAARIIATDSSMSHVLIRLIGDGPEKPALMRLVADSGLKNVIFSPPVSKDLIYKELQAASAFILHLKNSPLFSKHGISPNKLVDYMAMARPTIFAVSSQNNLVKEAGAGLSISASDPEALANAIKELVRMPSDQRWEMGMRGYRFITKNFSLDSNVMVLEKAFQEATRPGG
jgi:glycosyltransferase involved in cell wall biosynthesis